MKFKKGTRRKAIEYEKDLVQYWKKNQTFEKSVEQRPKEDAFVFYDGPPFITGVPHYGTLLSSIVKDAVPRFWTMQGKRVERTWGWDCHGLPAEVFTEKKLGIQDRRDIGTKVSLEEYILTCRENMVQTGSLWEDTIDRIGRWTDFRNTYRTMDKDYMESVWWAFKQLYDNGKIYEGEKVLLYCVRDATPISKAEVAMDNSYQDDTDPSIFAKFKLRDSDAYLLVWTTVPWTTIANTALAVNEQEEYSEVEVDGEHFILATALLDKALTDERHQAVPYTALRHFKGEELVGREYEPFEKDRGKGAHKVYHADFVDLEEGTGIVSIAPAYGEEDYALAKQRGVPVVSVVDDNGLLTEGDWKGQQIWEANKPIAKSWLEQGRVWKITYVTHSYPHCHRCATKLIYRAHPSWFMDINAQRKQMLEQNGEITWFPEHMKNGRFAKTVESAPDWNLSRDRFWATAMPVWKGKDKNGKEHIKVIGSYAELKELSGRELNDYHRPWIDDVTFEVDGVKYKRIDKVLDCWFESGSMPFAQFHYPFENKQKFEASFPGSFIAEYVGQVRAWFYYLHAISVGLFEKESFKNVIVTGTLAGNDGRKMSKNFGNYTDPNELIDKYSADSLRFLLLGSPLLNGEDFSLVDKDVADVARKLSMIWNMYDFFTLYADVDGWEWDGNYNDPSDDLRNPLDTWIVSRVHRTGEEIRGHMEGYDIPNAIKLVLPFIEDASNWYVRRSRRRFWKSEDDADKQNAYRTLHYILVQLAHLMAPFTPFLSEELYRKLTNGESVHLRDWPKPGRVNELTLDRMTYVREVINEGLSQRAAAAIKVRQPLQKLFIKGAPIFSQGMEEEYLTILKEELNVKEISVSSDDDAHEVKLATGITPELRREGMMREVIRNIQSARKNAGLEVNDRIHLGLSTADEELRAAIVEHTKVIAAETLAASVDFDRTYSYESACVIDAAPLTISLQNRKK
ncbi:MAG TPA: isoleucine--tRNA ligase [Patescibacteria group bacterium]|nr:isoleucine--tRNA ligase [Patescibacteria group bacterium]